MMKWFTKHSVVLLTLLLTSVMILGCSEYQIRHIADEVNTVNSQVADIAHAIGQAEYDDDETLNILRALQAGNTASAPFNPYALPIGAGLSGIIAMLEALRRVEKGKRKYAEQELNNHNRRNNNA